MAQTNTVLYGCLVSFGAVPIVTDTSYLSAGNRAKPRPLSYNLGQSLGVDTNAGGVVAYKGQENTWTLLLLAPDGTPEAECSAFVEQAYQTLDYYLSAPDPVTGLSQQTQLLVAQLRAGGTASCLADLVDLSMREQDRSYSLLTLNAVFQYKTEWA